MELRCIIAENGYIKLSIISVFLLTDSMVFGYLGDMRDEPGEEYRHQN